ncbi:MAG: TrbC/VirB2 family protein [Candidatus Shapirobacteria bacterium]
MLTYLILFSIIRTNNMANDITAYNTAQPIQFTSLDQLLWGVVKTLQYFSLPVMALSIAALGIALIASGDDTERKSRLKGWIFNILIGGLLVFGAASLASILKQFVGGTN